MCQLGSTKFHFLHVKTPHVLMINNSGGEGKRALGSSLRLNPDRLKSHESNTCGKEENLSLGLSWS